MRPYEVMVIFDVGTEPPAIQAVVDRLLETIRASDGAPGHVDRWGRRPFAYEVKHRREGYYVVVELSGEAKTVAEIDRLLSLADEVLRFKVIRIPDKIAARLASGGGIHPRSGSRGPASRPQGGRGPRSDAGRPGNAERPGALGPASTPVQTSGAESAASAGRSAAGEDEEPGTSGPGGGAETAAEEGAPPGAATDAAAPAAG
jgi:small subunit ribosomal protein S6